MSYSEINNATINGYFGESLRMAVANAIVRFPQSGKPLSLMHSAEIGVYTAIYEASDDWLRGKGWTIDKMMATAIGQGGTTEEAVVLVSKWLSMLVIRFGANMLRGKKQKFFDESLDLALTIGVRSLAGNYGWDNFTANTVPAPGPTPAPAPASASYKDPDAEDGN